MKITKRWLFTFVFASIVLAVAMACKTAPEPPSRPPQKEPEKAAQVKIEEKAPPVKAEPEEEKPEIVAEPPKVEPPPAEPAPFDPSSITKELFDSTKTDVQSLIERLNTIIRDKDYESWVTFLGKGYRTALSDPSFLERISSSTILRKQKITLKELKDYFIYVVVPSRTHDRVDDIEFIGQNRVKAFTVDSKGLRLRLYDLEKTPTGWEIIN